MTLVLTMPVTWKGNCKIKRAKTSHLTSIEAHALASWQYSLAFLVPSMNDDAERASAKTHRMNVAGPQFLKHSLLGICCWAVLSMILSNKHLSQESMKKEFISVDQSKQRLVLSSVSQDQYIGAAPIFSTSVRMCPAISPEELIPELHSQQEEDETLLQWFNGVCNGTYIEMGALDGIRYSNTFVFNKMFHWRGILVELSPTNYEKLVKNRQEEIANVNAAVCANRGKVHWYLSRSAATSGIWEFTSESYRTKWWKNATFNDTVPIKCSPLQDILEEVAPEHSFFDIFSLDVVGGEYEVLLSLDFEKVGFGMIVVEYGTKESRKNAVIRTLLETNGYHMVQRLGNSDIMVNNDFGNIYKGLIPDPVSIRTPKMDTVLKSASVSTDDEKDRRPDQNINETLLDTAGTTCIPSCNCTNLQFFGKMDSYKLVDMFKIDPVVTPTNTTQMQAVCVWNGKQVNQHLPHWLEIVYRCWSWWAMHNATHQAVIEVPEESQSYWKESLKSSLADGLWRHMKRALSMKIVLQDKKRKEAEGQAMLRATPVTSKTPWFTDVKAARSLRDYVVEKTFPGRSLSGCKQRNISLQRQSISKNESIHRSIHVSHARIGILDRLRSRRLLNHEEIVTAVQSLSSAPVSYKTFEGASFEEQIDFFSSVDIIVSPHGAQLSGVPFMPSCGAVLELLPKSYHIHDFFGPLTSSANLTSSYLYLSDGDPIEEMKNITSYELRKASRAASLCPPVSSIVASVQALIKRWESCCHEIIGSHR